MVDGISVELEGEMVYFDKEKVNLSDDGIRIEGSGLDGLLDEDKEYGVAIFSLSKSSNKVDESSKKTTKSKETAKSETSSSPKEEKEVSINEMPGEQLGNREIPVEANETRSVEVVDKGEKGDPIAKMDGGYTLIITESDAEIGDRIMIEIENVEDSYAFAKEIDTVKA